MFPNWKLDWLQSSPKDALLLRCRLSDSSAPLHVLIADSAQLRSQLIAGALTRRSDFRVSKCHMDAPAILAALRSATIDVVLADVERQEDITQELEAIRRVHHSCPDLPMVLLVNAYDDDLVPRAFQAGIRGLFCFATADFRLLCKCLHSVHGGQIWANSDQLGMLLRSVVHGPVLRVPPAVGKQLLSPREHDVVALVATGFSNRQIAAELKLSENTIKKYLFRIFDKLGISSRVELAVYAITTGPASPDQPTPDSPA
jgi:DNA-binding NarL/FixJ family response regulator